MTGWEAFLDFSAEIFPPITLILLVLVVLGIIAELTKG